MRIISFPHDRRFRSRTLIKSPIDANRITVRGHEIVVGLVDQRGNGGLCSILHAGGRP